MAAFDGYTPADWSTIISDIMSQANLSEVVITTESLLSEKNSPDPHVIEALFYPGKLVIRRIPLSVAKAVIESAAANPEGKQPEVYGDLALHGITKH